MRNRKNNIIEVVEETPVDEIEEVVEETPVDEIEEVVEETPVDEIEEVVEETPVDEIEEVVEETPVDEIEEVVEETPVEEKFVKVLATKLNVREDSNKDSNIVTVVEKDQVLKLIDLEPVNGFYHVDTLTGSEGYCMVEFIELV